MKKPDTFEFDWPETGKLEIMMRGPQSAVLRYAPSKAVIGEALQKAAQGSTRGREPQVSLNPSEQ